MSGHYAQSFIKAASATKESVNIKPGCSGLTAKIRCLVIKPGNGRDWANWATTCY